MLPTNQLTVLFASREFALLAMLESALASSGAHLEVVENEDAVVAALTASPPPDLFLLDANLARSERGANVEQILAAAHAGAGHPFPIILIADGMTEEWVSLLADGTVDDVVPGSTAEDFWSARIETVLRNFHIKSEWKRSQQTSVLEEQRDTLTGAYNRTTMLSMLFRETDRVQRMKTCLCLVIFELDDFLLEYKHADEVLCGVVNRTTRLLRSYDLMSRIGSGHFLLALPGCDGFNAMLLAERLRTHVFSTPFQSLGKAVLISASFGIASSEGRSPVVVLREAEQALSNAKASGSGRISCFGACQPTHAAPPAFRVPQSDEKLLCW